MKNSFGKNLTKILFVFLYLWAGIFLIIAWFSAIVVMEKSHQFFENTAFNYFYSYKEWNSVQLLDQFFRIQIHADLFQQNGFKKNQLNGSVSVLSSQGTILVDHQPLKKVTLPQAPLVYKKGRIYEGYIRNVTVVVAKGDKQKEVFLLKSATITDPEQLKPNVVWNIQDQIPKKLYRQHYEKNMWKKNRHILKEVF